MGFGGNLVQGFRVYAWRAVPRFPQIALCFPSLALRPQPFGRSVGWKMFSCLQRATPHFRWSGSRLSPASQILCLQCTRQWGGQTWGQWSKLRMQGGFNSHPMPPVLVQVFTQISTPNQFGQFRFFMFSPERSAQKFSESLLRNPRGNYRKIPTTRKYHHPLTQIEKLCTAGSTQTKVETK